MQPEVKVKDIMARIEEYDTINCDAPLCEAVALLRRNYERIQSGHLGKFHKTLLVTDEKGEICGKLSVFDLVRGLVPEKAKEPVASRTLYSLMSGRSSAAVDVVQRLRERFDWLEKSFSDLVQDETRKKIKDVMSPIHPLLEEEDTLSKAVYVMFRDNTRQLLVVRGNTIVGVINLMDIFPVLLNIAGDVCHL